MAGPDAPRLPFIDGLRALAVVAVMVYHLDPRWLPGGFVGVDVFFVISGFVVTASLAGHGHEHLGRFLAGFYARRLARLMPALVLMLLLTTLAYVLLVPKAWFNRAAESVGQAAFWGLSNWTLDRHAINYFEPRAELNPFTHTWSLGVEEQFYLAAPLLLFAALRAGAPARSRRAAAVLVALLALASLVACQALGLVHGARFVFYQVIFRFWELAAGVLLFLGLRQVRPLCARWDTGGGRTAWAGLLLVLAAMALPRPEAYPLARAALAVVGTLLLIGPAPNDPRDAVRRRLTAAMAVWLGERSYALYLWHWPVYVLARWTVGLAQPVMLVLAPVLSLLLAAASYRFVEHPLRLQARRSTWPPGRRIALFFIGIGAAWLAGQALLDAQPRLGLGRVTREAADWYGERRLLAKERAAARRCDPVRVPVAIGALARAGTRFEPRACATPGLPQPLVLGDSHATAYLPMLEQLSAEQGRSVLVLPTPGCSYLDLKDALDARRQGACHRIASDGLKALLAEARPGDIVFLPALRLPRLVELGGSRRGAGAPAGTDLFVRTAAERAGLARAVADAPIWLDPIAAAGVHIVLEAPKPVFALHPFACVETWQRWNPECRAGFDIPKPDVERYRAPTLRALQGLAAAMPRSHVWDPLPALCGGATCSALRQGRPLFFDGDHLSPYGNLVLLPDFAAALAAIDHQPAASGR